MEASSNPSAAVELVRSRRCSRLQTLHWRIASADWSHHSQAPESRDTKSHFIHAEWFAIENIVQHGLMFGWRLATNICGLDCICHTWRHGKGYTCGLGKEKKTAPTWLRFSRWLRDYVKCEIINFCFFLDSGCKGTRWHSAKLAKIRSKKMYWNIFTRMVVERVGTNWISTWEMHQAITASKIEFTYKNPRNFMDPR